MPKIVPREIQKRILDELKSGLSNKEIAERYDLSEEYVSRLKHRGKELPLWEEGKMASKVFKFFKEGGNVENAVIQLELPYESANGFWDQWCDSKRDEFREREQELIRLLDEKNKQIRALQATNSSLSDEIYRLQSELETSPARIFREVMLLRALIK